MPGRRGYILAALIVLAVLAAGWSFLGGWYGGGPLEKVHKADCGPRLSGGDVYTRRITRFRISLISSIAKRMPSRPSPESLTPP